MRMKVFFVFVLGMMLLARAGYAADFSADMVSSTPEGAFTAKIYVSGDNSRMEMPEAISITRLDKKIVWVLMSEQKMYIEQPIDLRAAAGMQENITGEVERKSEGNETVNGRATTKYLIVFEAQGKRSQIFQWLDEEAHIPVKIAAVDGSWSSEFKNIKIGSQDPALFELPDGYKKMAFDMSAMMDMQKE